MKGRFAEARMQGFGRDVKAAIRSFGDARGLGSKELVEWFACLLVFLFVCLLFTWLFVCLFVY